MAKLQCEVCGGKLMGRPGGIFECDSCGMEYDTAWAKEKIQEIKGTVKVEGTVQVTGTVKLDGPVKVEGGVSIQSLCQRGFFELENGRGDEASDAFGRALDIDLSWGDAYMGLIMCEYDLIVKTKEEFRKRMLRHEFDKEPHFQKFLQLSGSDEHQELVAAYRQMQASEAETVEKNHRRGWEKKEYYRELREKYYPVRGRITRDCEYALNEENRLIPIMSTFSFPAETPWTDMVWIGQIWKRTGSLILMGMYADGTVIAEDSTQRIEIFEPEDRVTEVCAMESGGGQHFLGLREDGSLVTAFCDPDYYTQKIFNDCKERWNGKKIESLCEVNRDYYTTENRLQVIASGGDIVWEETDTDRMAVQLHADGTVSLLRSVHHTLDSQVTLWSDIIQVVSSSNSVVGLKCDGTVVYAFPYDVLDRFDKLVHIQYEVQQWKNIVFIRVLGDEVLGVTRDGKMVAASGYYPIYMRNLKTGFKLFDNIDTLADRIAKRRAEAYAEWKRGISKWTIEEGNVEDATTKEQREYLRNQIDAIHAEISGLKGIFAMKRRKELEERMGQLLLELDELD